MTKINKLGKSTFVIAILSFILVAVLAFGGTYAYFSAVSGRAAGRVQTGHLDLDATGDVVTKINSMAVANNIITQPGQRLVAADMVDGVKDDDGANLSVTVNSNIDYYIRVKFEVKVTTNITIENKRQNTSTAYAFQGDFVSSVTGTQRTITVNQPTMVTLWTKIMH